VIAVPRWLHGVRAPSLRLVVLQYRNIGTQLKEFDSPDLFFPTGSRAVLWMENAMKTSVCRARSAPVPPILVRTMGDCQNEAGHREHPSGPRYVHRVQGEGVRGMLIGPLLFFLWTWTEKFMLCFLPHTPICRGDCVCGRGGKENGLSSLLC
jgi:hypothetical protein